MEHHRWHWLPISLVGIGVVAVVVGAAANAHLLGWWQLPIYGGCLAAAAAVVAFRRKLSATEVELEALRRRLAGEETRLASERSQFEELRLAMQEELTQEAGRLNKREQALADRLVTYHEWMEFPQPIDLAGPPHDDTKLADLARKDRQMIELLKAETKTLYDNILQNKYAPAGAVLLPAIRDDVVLLVRKVARIYQPTVEQPLLEASLTRIFRATSRASLQMLVVLDELPVDVKHASLNTLYGYVRRAVGTWRMYKSAEPYWPYLNTAYYLGRFALGANPLTLGAWWFVGNLGSRGAQAIAQHVINRQALALLSGLVRIIGYEVAGIYGGDFRRRDANWIYAAELTELINEFALSRDSLAHALREIGALELRSEYDRIYLYRCLANRKSAEPQRYAATAVLTMEERRAVATRLERFLEAFVHGKSAERVNHWKDGAERRLGIKLSVAMKSAAASVREQIQSAASSLVSFLVAIKQLEPREAVDSLSQSAVLHELSDGDRAELLAGLAENASYFFEHPDLDPDGDLADKFLDDLAALNAQIAPRAAGIEDTLTDMAAFLRRQPKAMQTLIDKHYISALFRRLPADTPQRRVPAAAARAALDLLADETEPPRFLYGPARLQWPDGSRPSANESDSLWLLGVGQRLILFSIGDQPRVVWRGAPGTVHAEAGRQLLATHCRLTGGQWQAPAIVQPLAIRLNGGLVANYSQFFRPLLSLLGDPAGTMLSTQY
jgi:hypothetical protein